MAVTPVPVLPPTGRVEALAELAVFAPILTPLLAVLAPVLPVFTAILATLLPIFMTIFPAILAVLPPFLAVLGTIGAVFASLLPVLATVFATLLAIFTTVLASLPPYFGRSRMVWPLGAPFLASFLTVLAPLLPVRPLDARGWRSWSGGPTFAGFAPSFAYVSAVLGAGRFLGQHRERRGRGDDEGRERRGDH
ncbi:MAG TPA: hypothetical protein VFF66_03380 [Brevundimonas sp.]|nr:hypothetical protein [Brevundimonas sp.]